MGVPCRSVTLLIFYSKFSLPFPTQTCSCAQTLCPVPAVLKAVTGCTEPQPEHDSSWASSWCSSQDELVSGNTGCILRGAAALLPAASERLRNSFKNCVQCKLKYTHNTIKSVIPVSDTMPKRSQYQWPAISLQNVLLLEEPDTQDMLTWDLLCWEEYRGASDCNESVLSLVPPSITTPPCLPQQQQRSQMTRTSCTPPAFSRIPPRRCFSIS